MQSGRWELLPPAPVPTQVPTRTGSAYAEAGTRAGGASAVTGLGPKFIAAQRTLALPIFWVARANPSLPVMAVMSVVAPEGVVMRKRTFAPATGWPSRSTLALM